jgi:hypothetical protein
MGWYIPSQVLTILISIVRIGRMSEQEKDLEILILRQQLAILQRKQEKPVKTNSNLSFAVKDRLSLTLTLIGHGCETANALVERFGGRRSPFRIKIFSKMVESHFT